MSVSLHRLTRTSWSSFPAAFAVLSQNKEWQATFLHSAEVRCFTHERSYPCCTSELHARPHFLGVGPSIRTKPITVLLRDPAHPPFCSSDLGIHLPTTVSYTTVVPPSVTLAGLLQSIIDAKTTHPVRWGGACLPTHWFPAGHQPGLAIRQCAKGKRYSWLPQSHYRSHGCAVCTALESLGDIFY